MLPDRGQGVIENDRQLAITMARAPEFEAAISAASNSGPAPDVDPVIHMAYVGGMESQLATLRAEIARFQQTPPPDRQKTQ